MNDSEARASALEAADRLFTMRGVRTVGMDDVRDASGVSLKRLYKLYSSKEELAEEALDQAAATFLAELRAYVGKRPNPEAKLLAVFEFLGKGFAEPDYRGCPFIRAYDEMNAQSPAVVAAVERQKRDLRDFLAGLVAEADRPAALADQLSMLANGAMVTAAILDADAAADDLRAAAEALIGVAARSPATGPPTT